MIPPAAPTWQKWTLSTWLKWAAVISRPSASDQMICDWRIKHDPSQLGLSALSFQLLTFIRNEQEDPFQKRIFIWSDCWNWSIRISDRWPFLFIVQSSLSAQLIDFITSAWMERISRLISQLFDEKTFANYQLVWWIGKVSLISLSFDHSAVDNRTITTKLTSSHWHLQQKWIGLNLSCYPHIAGNINGNENMDHTHKDIYTHKETKLKVQPSRCRTLAWLRFYNNDLMTRCCTETSEGVFHLLQWPNTPSSPPSSPCLQHSNEIRTVGATWPFSETRQVLNPIRSFINV